MTRSVPEVLDSLAEQLAELSLALRSEAVGGTRRAPDAPGAASFDELPPEYPDDWEGTTRAASQPAGSAAVCPAHNIPYRKGRYGMYCPSTSEDPNWRNDKGYCTITPKSAAAWMRQHA